MSIDYTNNWFIEAVPMNKIDRRKQSVQVGVHIEEVVEMLQSFTLEGFETKRAEAIVAMHELAEIMKKNPDAIMKLRDRQEFLDACADQIVTATGSAYMQGMDIVGALNEVNKSNFSKFKDGRAIFNEFGKIAKNPETYKEPELKPFIGIDPVQG